MNKALHIAIPALLALFSAGCTSEEVKNTLSRQETNIENFVKARLAADENAYVVTNKGSSRVVMTEGEGETLNGGGTVTFYYAGYVLTSSSISSSNLFATNREEVANAAGWSLTGQTFGATTLNLDEAGLVEGLRNGLEGVKGGQECYILFSGRHGFGNKDYGTIPANSALAYHIWIESISND